MVYKDVDAEIVEVVPFVFMVDEKVIAKIVEVVPFVFRGAWDNRPAAPNLGRTNGECRDRGHGDPPTVTVVVLWGGQRQTSTSCQLELVEIPPHGRNMRR